MKSIAAPCLSYRVARARFVQVGAEFLAQHYPVHTVLLPNPTWANHNKIFPLAGIKDVRKYRYFKPATKGLDYEVCSTSSSLSHSFTKVCLAMPSAPDVRLRSFSGSFSGSFSVNAAGTWKAIQLLVLLKRALEGRFAG